MSISQHLTAVQEVNTNMFNHANKDSYKFSFFPRSVVDWNHLPASITSLDKLDKFKTGLYAQCAIVN